MVVAFILAVMDLKFCEDFPVGLGGEVFDGFFFFVDEGEGGGLDAADGGDLAASLAEHAGGYGACAVDADEPVGLRSAAGGVL